MEQFDLFIVGAGAAGLSAASAAWDAGTRSILVCDREDAPGGVLPRCIHHGFGISHFGEELTGPEYASRLWNEFSRTGAELRLGTAVLSVFPDRTAVLSGRDGLHRISFDRMILASGSREISIGSLPVAGTRPAGVFTAGQAQEMINLQHLAPGRDILILGSGDLGMIMARRFTLEGKHVIAVVEKEDHYGGMARNYRRCMEQYSIPLIFRAEVTRLWGEGRLEAVTLHRTDSGKDEIISCDTLVTALGLTPERSLIGTLGMPEWLRLCGNCSRVHDIADSASDEARMVGRSFGGKPHD